ncbi:hypothetical protein BASA83_006388 [Batrachochytrium salamandrivorans]|nr:hypothetical protein BASA83_006388 [Batrachochytrium salamandrivorans]
MFLQILVETLMLQPCNPTFESARAAMLAADYAYYGDSAQSMVDRHSSTDHFVCIASARALLTSPCVDRQTAVTDHFVIRISWLRGGVLNGEVDLGQRWLDGDCGA